MLFRLFTLLAVIALAVSTWILSSPAHRPVNLAADDEAALPGYYLKNATLTDFDAEGLPSMRLEAERIDQVGHGNEVQLYNVQVHYEAPGGQSWVLVGDTAHVQPGGKIVDVAGNVRLQEQTAGSTASAVIRSEAMSYDVPDTIASTKNDVRIDYGGHILTAHGLSANLKERTIRLESKVNGRFLP